MGRKLKQKLEWAMKDNPVFLLICLFLLPLVSPAFEGKSLARLVINLFFSLILVSSAWSVLRSRRSLVLVLLLGGPSIILSWLTDLTEVAWPVAFVGALLLTVFFVTVMVMLLAKVMTAPAVTADTLARAICGYMLLGMAWAATYRALTLVHSSAIQPLSRASTWHDFVYFSFTVLTTLGFGDVTPVSPYAKSLVVIESVTGPLYMTILIARLVALYQHTPTDRRPPT